MFDRFGSKADISLSRCDVRFTPGSSNEKNRLAAGDIWRIIDRNILPDGIISADRYNVTWAKENAVRMAPADLNAGRSQPQSEVPKALAA